MSAFDDEFGLFSETVVEDVEREPTRRAQTRAPQTQARPAQSPPRSAQAPPRPAQAPPRPARPPERRERRSNASSSDPWAGHRRATELLSFLARKLVANPDTVAVELFVDESAQPVIELIVHPDDLGKVIGRSGRVAHALRTIVRATAEGRVAVDILDSEEAAEGAEDPAGEE
ncbi:MAG TPA: KH domain-containing protein [Candidatus Cybelea sp.]|nr:KH domain-containing protein [Candidatus Cybelea sp.]